MELSRTEYTDALADLNRVINDKDTRQLKRNLQAAIPRLKQELEEKKFSNKERKKRIKDAEENLNQESSSGIVESHPHGINITKEAPNYSR